MTPLFVVLILVLLVGSLGAVFWNVLRAEPNSGPALGTNNPYPNGVGLLGSGDDEPPFLPTPVISEAEEFRRDAHRRLAELHRPSGTGPVRSWMEEPGAMEAAGLVDRSEPITESRSTAPRIKRDEHRRGKRPS
jgi:hypothetical protein